MTEITAKLSTALANRYRIERHLGEGGMATVYLAEDLKHKRKVAGKVLRPELAAVLGAFVLVAACATELLVLEFDSPVATIFEPQDGAEFAAPDTVRLRGSGVDGELEAIIGAALAWESDLAGTIGVGDSIDWLNASVGEHAIRFIATDASGRSDTAHAVVTVHNNPPVVELTVPDVGTTGQPILIQIHATDVEDGTLPDASLTARSSIDGPLGTGSELTVHLSEGVHEIVAAAVDSHGDSATTLAPLQIFDPANERPSATITSPVHGNDWIAGETVSFAGSATDPEDGPLAASSLTWWVDFHHETHTHPFRPATSGITSGTVTLPTRGETSAAVWYRFYLRAEDSTGFADTTWVEIFPVKSHLTFGSVPAGLRVTLDGQPRTTPFSVEGVVGVERDLGVESPQDFGGRSYRFQTWEHGGDSTQTIVTPPADSTFTAVFAEIAPANIPPTVVLVSPVEGARIVEGTPTTLEASASDTDGSVTVVEVYDGTTFVGRVLTPPYEVMWTPAGLGAHVLRARATDEDNAVTDATPVNVLVIASGIGDTEAPVIAIVTPTDSAGGLSPPVSILVNASDNVGVDAVEIQVDGENAGPPLTTAPYELVVNDLTPYAMGPHQIRARARDAAGNYSQWATVSVGFGAAAGSLPAGFEQTVYVTGLSAYPPRMTLVPDGRLFIAEKGGALRVVENGLLLSQPFVSLTVDATGERGFLGVALHPNFQSNGWVYVNYTTAQSFNRVSRFTADGNVADGTGETVIVDLPPLGVRENHNGGAIQFGTDGKLYVSLGDNGEPSFAQSMTTVFGKILRFNDDGSIPADNPFFSSTSGLNRSIWALGLRNPFSFAIDSLTGIMLINDVGSSAWEEINLGRAGANYGWPTTEGYSNQPGIDGPEYAYPNGFAADALVWGIAVVGSGFYPSSATAFPPSYRGQYYFGDFGGGWVYRLDPEAGNAVYAFANPGVPMTDVKVGTDGAVYVVAQMQGGWGIYRIAHQP